MPFSEENVLDFVKWLEKSYFVERALGRIEKLLAPEFMMVGTGRREVCCCFSKRMRKVFRKNEKSMLQNCNKKAKRKGRLQRVKKPM